MLLNKILSINLLNMIQQPEMAEFLRSSGKIYVVVTVLSIIFIGIVAYLVLLDKKISKLEKLTEHQNKN